MTTIAIAMPTSYWATIRDALETAMEADETLIENGLISMDDEDALVRSIAKKQRIHDRITEQLGRVETE